MICFPPRHMWPCFHSFSQVEWWQHCLADDTASISDYQFCFINWVLKKSKIWLAQWVFWFLSWCSQSYKKNAFLPLVVNLESVSVCLQQWPGKCVCVFTAVTWKVCLCLYSHVYLFTWKVLWLLVGFHLDSDREKRFMNRSFCVDELVRTVTVVTPHLLNRFRSVRWCDDEVNTYRGRSQRSPAKLWTAEQTPARRSHLQTR